MPAWRRRYHRRMTDAPPSAKTNVRAKTSHRDLEEQPWSREQTCPQFEACLTDFDGVIEI